MLNKSVLLNYLTELSKKMMEADKRKALSANYLFIALLQIIIFKESDSLPEEINNEDSIKELDAVCVLLSKYNLDCEADLKELLLAIHADSYSPTMDEFVFSKINYSVQAKAKQMGKTVIDMPVLVGMILEEPSDAISRFVMKEVDSADTEADDKTAEASKAKKTGEKKSAMGAEKLSNIVNTTGKIQKKLLENVFGQDYAVESFVSGYFQSELMASARKESKKPKATFLFAGPPGVGKTFLAENVADALGLPYRRFDMSEYSDKEANFEFCGSDKVYKNGQPGNVTKFVYENPKCVILFDEIEKAHLNVIHLFLQILDAGRIRDNFTDEEVSFSKAVIIFTTNAGKNLYDDTSITNLSTLPRKKILSALERDMNPVTNAPLFPAAICSRFAAGNVVMFNRLGAANLYAIAKRELNGNISGFEKAMGIKLELDENIPTAILLAEGGKADARTVKGRSNAFFHDELYELLRLLSANENAVKSLTSIKVKASFDGSDADVTKMFVNSTKPSVLIFADPKAPELKGFAPDGIECHITDSMDEAKEILFNYDISVILCDVFCKAQQGKRVLNAEDMMSVGREFLTYALTRYSVPTYLLTVGQSKITREEFLSFAKLGVQDWFILDKDREAFTAQLADKCSVAYQQSNMLKLARENKVVTFKTSQTLSDNGNTAEITLYNFNTSLATDIDDSQNILDSVSKPDVVFEDVIGAKDAKKELAYFVEYLKDPVKYIRKGVRAPKGVLLYGPPGTGKTMLAKAMAGESNVTFLAAEGNQFLKRFVGEGATAVHDLFKSARKYAPSILFIDEIDAIGKDRNGAGAESSGDVLTAFLTEMDGFNTDTSKPVFVLAATNYDIEPGKGRSLDAALLRRFDRRIYIDLPTKEERKKFLRVKSEGSKIVKLSDEQIENIAVRSTGMSLAELDSVFEMAIRNAICTENGIVDDASFEEAFETFNSGEEKKWSRDSLERVARHEAGHALLCWMDGEKPSYLTVVARGDHGGYMQHGDREGKGIYTKAELLARIRVSLAGRASEMVYYGSEGGISTGASGDLYSATSLAEHMICSYGMIEEIGLAYVQNRELDSVRSKVNEILAAELKNTVEVIERQRTAVDKIVEALMEKNHLKGNEIDEIFTATVKK